MGLNVNIFNERKAFLVVLFWAVSGFVFADTDVRIALKKNQDLAANTENVSHINQAIKPPEATLITTKGMPDLIPVMDQFDTQGIIKVKNIGNKKSNESWLAIDCDALDEYSCPELTPVQKAHYTISGTMIPSLNPNQTYTHILQFWGDLVFKKGRYVFSFEADSTNSNSESNEANNLKQYTLDR